MYKERTNREWNITIERVGFPAFSHMEVRVEWVVDEPSPLDTISWEIQEFLRYLLWDDYQYVADNYSPASKKKSENVKKVLEILENIAPCLVNGYFAWPNSQFQRPLASKVRGNFFDGFWEDPRIALRATSQPSIFDTNLQRTTQIFEWVVIENVFLLHYPWVTLAPSQASFSVGKYVAKNFLEVEPKIQKVLEVGTWGGVITLAMMRNSWENIDFTATDIDGKVLTVAQLNAEIGKFDFSRLSLIQSNLFDNIHPNAGFDTIVSNPPFYDTQWALQVVRDPKYVWKVPLIAIDWGKTGLEFYEKILREWQTYLNAWWKFVFQVSAKISLPVLQLGEEILWKKCRKAYCIKEGKKTRWKGMMVIFECE